MDVLVKKLGLSMAQIESAVDWFAHKLMYGDLGSQPLSSTVEKRYRRWQTLFEFEDEHSFIEEDLASQSEAFSHFYQSFLAEEDTDMQNQYSNDLNELHKIVAKLWTDVHQKYLEEIEEEMV